MRPKEIVGWKQSNQLHRSSYREAFFRDQTRKGGWFGEKSGNEPLSLDLGGASEVAAV